MRVEDGKKVFGNLFKEIQKEVMGQEETIAQVMISLITDSHALLEGFPGLAKTLMIRTVAQLVDLKFARIQNTPDLMPSDITGTYIIEEAGGKRTFKFQPGPIFANVVLADEINRATPKTQSAMLEAMQERQVTVGGVTYPLERPFFVLATQNPIEQEGSLALSESVFINGQLKTGKELISKLTTPPLIEDERGVRLYDIDGWTMCLNKEGKLVKTPCYLYTLPYQDEHVTVSTRTGRSITVTKNHPFLVNENGHMIWKKAEELTKEDYLVSPARLDVDVVDAPKHSMTAGVSELPFNDDFAFWIAFVLSDGSINDKSVQVCQKNYPTALDRWVTISNSFGFKTGVRTDKSGCRYATIYSKSLVQYLQQRFDISIGTKKTIPSWFLRWPHNMLKEFVKTFIGLESSYRDNRITFTQKKSQDVNTISYMLLRLGILSWMRHDGRVWRLKIQGEDCLTYLSKVGWLKPTPLPSVGKTTHRVVPVDRSRILRLVECLGLNSFHTLKDRQSITSRSWYGSYKGIKEGETLMARDSLREFIADIQKEVKTREKQEFKQNSTSDVRTFAAGIGTPITEVADELKLSKYTVAEVYAGRQTHQQVSQCLLSKHQNVLQEARQILGYCETLLSTDIFYDRVKTIHYTEQEPMAFGLTVPEVHNYVAGFGACGINKNTYPLPEAQADRFLLKILVGYPSFEEELEIVEKYAEDVKPPVLKPVLTKKDLTEAQALCRQIPVATDMKKYAVTLVDNTRKKKDLIEFGASPRASIGLVLAAKARALLAGRKYVVKEDINAVALPVLRHRIILTFEAERQNMNSDDVIKKLLR
jgi:MoxR-like ATPase/intein/homing endonuclease